MKDEKKLEDNQFEAAGFTWTFRVTAADALRLKNDYAFDIRSIAEQDKLQELLDDSLTVLNLMAATLGKQLEARSMTAQELFEKLDGDAVEQAVYCWLAGCIGFFPLAKRLPLLELLRAITTNANQLGYSVAETIKIESAEMTKQALESIQKTPPTTLSK